MNFNWRFPKTYQLQITFKMSQPNFQNYLDEETRVNGCLTAPPQRGKTEAIALMMKMCFEQNFPVIISSADKIDQQNQLFSRIKKSIADNVYVKRLLKTSDKNFTKKVLEFVENSLPFAIFCLDNSSQLEKILVTLSQCAGRPSLRRQFYSIEQFVIIHDEGDVIQKDFNVTTRNETQAVSHRKWIEIVDFFKDSFKYKRLFVTATPENVLSLYDVHPDFIFKLNTSETFSGHRKIEKNVLNNYKNVQELENILQTQIDRIYGNLGNNPVGEAILYVMDRNISISDKSGNCQNASLDSLFNKFRRYCTICTYQGPGITVATDNRHLIQALFNIPFIDKKGNIFVRQPLITNGRFMSLHKDFTIASFYSLCKQTGVKIVITIGKDLINRGISFVSECSENQLCATTMIYHSNTMHAVGIAQTIGRLNGNVRPDLPRILYATQDVINAFTSYHLNQEDFLNNHANTSWNNFEFSRRIGRHIDRPKLKLNPKYSAPPIYTAVDGEIDGVKLHLLRKWLEEDVIIGKMVRFLYQLNNEINREEFKSGTNYEGSLDQFNYHIDTGRGPGCTHGFLWKVSGNKVVMNQKIREYIDTI